MSQTCEDAADFEQDVQQDDEQDDEQDVQQDDEQDVQQQEQRKLQHRKQPDLHPTSPTGDQGSMMSIFSLNEEPPVACAEKEVVFIEEMGGRGGAELSGEPLLNFDNDSLLTEFSAVFRWVENEGESRTVSHPDSTDRSARSSSNMPVTSRPEIADLPGAPALPSPSTDVRHISSSSTSGRFYSWIHGTVGQQLAWPSVLDLSPRESTSDLQYTIRCATSSFAANVIGLHAVALRFVGAALSRLRDGVAAGRVSREMVVRFPSGATANCLDIALQFVRGSARLMVNPVLMEEIESITSEMRELPGITMQRLLSLMPEMSGTRFTSDKSKSRTSIMQDIEAEILARREENRLSELSEKRHLEFLAEVHLSLRTLVLSIWADVMRLLAQTKSPFFPILAVDAFFDGSLRPFTDEGRVIQVFPVIFGSPEGARELLSELMLCESFVPKYGIPEFKQLRCIVAPCLRVVLLHHLGRPEATVIAIVEAVASVEDAMNNPNTFLIPLQITLLFAVGITCVNLRVWPHLLRLIRAMELLTMGAPLMRTCVRVLLRAVSSFHDFETDTTLSSAEAEVSSRLFANRLLWLLPTLSPDGWQGQGIASDEDRAGSSAVYFQDIATSFENDLRAAMVQANLDQLKTFIETLHVIANSRFSSRMQIVVRDLGPGTDARISKLTSLHQAVLTHIEKLRALSTEAILAGAWSPHPTQTTASLEGNEPPLYPQLLHPFDSRFAHITEIINALEVATESVATLAAASSRYCRN